MGLPWQQRSVPTAVSSIPSMLTAEELQYLSWLTASAWQGHGAIVDLGPWLGCSTAALAHGLSERAAVAKVHSLDLFRWRTHYMDQHRRPTDGPPLRDGDDFLDEFRRWTQPYARWIEAQRADLLEATWNGGEIEILFVDAAKSWALLNATLKTFGPHLRPGASRVVLQDFGDYHTHWLPLVFDSRPDLWREVEAVEIGTTVTFEPLRALRAGDQGYSEASFSVAAAERILARRQARATRPDQRARYGAAAMRKAILSGDVERAQDLRTELLREHGEVANVASMIVNAEATSRSERLVARLQEAHAALERGDALHAATDIVDGLLEGPGADLPTRRWAFGLLELAWTRLQDAAITQQGLQRLLPIYADSADFQLLEGIVLCLLGRRDDGHACLRRAAALDPEHPRARALLREWFP